MNEQLADYFASSSINAWDLAIGVIALVLGWLGARTAGRAVAAGLGRLQGISEASIALAARVTKYLILIVAAGVALSFIGGSTEPLLAVVIVVSVIAVLALRGIADNFSAGVVLQTRRPLRVGDEVRLAGETGVVAEMNARAVIIHTFDGRAVHVPNADVLREPLANHSVLSARRSELEVRVVKSGDDTQLVDLIVSAVLRAEGVRAEPSPTCLIVSESITRVICLLRFWHDPRGSSSARSAAVRSIYSALRDANMTATVTSSLPEPPLTPPDMA